MIKNFLILLVAAFIVFSGTVMALSEQEAESTCRQYASEDGVEAHELDAYIVQCMKDLAAEAPETTD